MYDSIMNAKLPMSASEREARALITRGATEGKEHSQYVGKDHSDDDVEEDKVEDRKVALACGSGAFDNDS